MPRYIDADLLKLQIERGAEMTERGICLLDLSQQPTVDAVEVVRCKDCWHHNSCGIEQAALAPIGFFCALGERKDDAK